LLSSSSDRCQSLDFVYSAERRSSGFDSRQPASFDYHFARWVIIRRQPFHLTRRFCCHDEYRDFFRLTSSVFLVTRVTSCRTGDVARLPKRSVALSAQGNLIDGLCAAFIIRRAVSGRR